MPSLDVRYFDQANWIFRRPQVPPQPFTSLSVIVGGGPDIIAPLVKVLTEQHPTVVALLEVTPDLFKLIEDNDVVRKGYGVTDYKPSDCSFIAHDQVASKVHTCVFLVRHGVTPDFAEHNIKAEWGQQQGVRPSAVLHVRQILGVSFNFAAAHFEPSASPSARANAIESFLTKVDPCDVAFLAANFYDAIDGAAMRSECLPILRSKPVVSEWIDTCEMIPVNSGGDRGAQSGLWVRFKNGSTLNAASCVPLPLKGAKYAYITHFAQSGAKPAAVPANSTPTGMMIPQPRSAKASKSPCLVPTPMSVDPAIVSIEEPAHREPNVADLLNASKRVWKTDPAHMKQLQKPLSEFDEFDLTRKFNSLGECVEALNSGRLLWRLDFVLYGANLLACDGVRNLSVKEFKRYAERVSKLNRSAGRSPSTLDAPDTSVAATPSATPTSTTVQSVAPVGASPVSGVPPTFSGVIPRPAGNRPRVWSMGSTTVVYQITPWEMVFDITHLAGQSSSSLANVLEKLNSKKTATVVDEKSKDDPLQSYPYDYALLLGVDKQHYHLLAANDVPCDIVACREMARCLGKR